MAATFQAAGTLGAVSSGNVTPGLPSGWAADDIHVLAVMTNQGNTFPTPSGWTVLGTAVNSANQSTAWFWRRAVGGDTDPSFTIASGTALGNTNGLYARIYGFRGCVTSGTPMEAVGNAGTPTSSTTPQSSAVTTTGPNELVVCLLMADDDNTWSSGMPPTGWANAGPRLASTTGGDCMADAIAITRASAGTEAAVTVGTMSAADFWRTLSFALLPGATIVSGTGTGGASTSGSASGLRIVQGSGTGGAGTAGASTGLRIVTGSGTGSVTTAGEATGQEPPVTGTGTGGASTSGAASGLRLIHGTGTGPTGTGGSGTGLRIVQGIASGSAVTAGSLFGLRQVVGLATGTASTTAEAVGLRLVTATAVGSATTAGEATGSTGAETIQGTATGGAVSGGFAASSVPDPGVVLATSLNNRYTATTVGRYGAALVDRRGAALHVRRFDATRLTTRTTASLRRTG